MNKFKILWIEDVPDEGFPDRNLDAKFQPYFEISYKKNGLNEPIKCINEYHQAMLWDGEQSVFPVEIVAADYDLSKFSARSLQKNSQDTENDNDFDYQTPISTKSEKKSYSQSDLKLPTIPDKDINYAGFLIEIIHAFYFAKHPAGIIATTYKGDAMPAAFSRVHAILNRLCHVDTTFPDKKLKEGRTWENIINAGVKSLRLNLKKLFSCGDIIISLNDLMALAENSGHESIMVQSPHAVRNFPVQGLFIDLPEEQRPAAIKKWTEELLRLRVLPGHFKIAKHWADVLWTKYNDDVLMSDLFRLSYLHDAKDFGEEYSKLEKKFKPKKTSRSKGDNESWECTENCCDLKNVQEIKQTEDSPDSTMKKKESRKVLTR